jgi:hypothetical protein
MVQMQLAVVDPAMNLAESGVESVRVTDQIGRASCRERV